MNELFSTYKAVEPMNDVVENPDIPDFKSKYDTFLDTLARYRKATSEQKVNTTTENGDQRWFSNTKLQEPTTISASETPGIDYTTKDLSTMLKEQGLDKYIRISSGFRDHNVGKAGNKSNHRRKNAHGHSMAYDIVPLGEETFDSIYARIKNNEAMQKWLSQNGFNINDETDAATLKKTGGTGAHFHIGPDSFNVRKAAEGIDTSDIYSVYDPVVSKETHIPNISVPDFRVPTQDDDYAYPEIPERSDAEAQPEDNQKWFKHTKIQTQDNGQPINTKQDDSQPIGDPAIKSPGFDADFAKYGTSEIFTKHKNFWKRLALSESSFNPNAANKSGAFGYFQIMPKARTGSDVQTQFQDAENLMNNLMSSLSEEDKQLARQRGFSEEALMAGVWLGGPGGVKKALRGKGNAKDSNGTSVLQYMKKFN